MAVDAEALLIRLEATSEQLRREMRRAQQTVNTGSRRMERDIGRLDRAMDRLNRMAGTLRGTLGLLGAGLSIRGLQILTTGALRTADSLNTTAQRVALSVETLQELRSAAAEVNVQSNQLDMGMQRFTRRLAEAAQGGGELKGVLEQYNIAVRDANGGMRSSEEVLMDLADAIQGAESDGERLRIAFKAFDSEGAALVNLLRRGSQGLEEARKRSRDYGHVMSGEVVDGASKANTELNNLFQTIRTQTQEGLLRTLTGDMEDLSEISKDQTFHDGLKGLGVAVGFFGRHVAGAVEDLGRLIQFFRDPSFMSLMEFGGRYVERGTFGAISFDGALEHDHRQAVTRLGELQARLARLKDEGAPGAHIRQTEREIQQTLDLINELEDRLMSRPLEVTIDRGTIVNDPPGEPPGSAPGTPSGATIDAGAQAALAAMQQAAAVRDAHADAVGALLTGLRQEAEMNELTLRYLHDQSGELEVQQRLLEIRQQLGAEAAAEAEPVLRHIQEQTNAIERQTNAYQVLNTSAERAFDRIGGAMTRMFMEGEDAAITWHNTVNAVLSEIMQTMLQLALINPFKNALFGGNAATLGDVGGILGEIFHSGGIVGGPAATRMVNPLVFAGAPRMHSGGIAGDEVPAILRRGEEVLPANHPRHRNNAGGDANVTIPVSITNNAPVQVRTRQSQAPGGGRQLEILVDELNARNIGSPGTASNKAIRTGFGAQPLLTSRG